MYCDLLLPCLHVLCINTNIDSYLSFFLILQCVEKLQNATLTGCTSPPEHLTGDIWSFPFVFLYCLSLHPVSLPFSITSNSLGTLYPFPIVTSILYSYCTSILYSYPYIVQLPLYRIVTSIIQLHLYCMVTPILYSYPYIVYNGILVPVGTSFDLHRRGSKMYSVST